MNTLAGRILISYVCSQLIGYVVLCVETVVDFQQDTHKCFILGKIIPHEKNNIRLNTL